MAPTDNSPRSCDFPSFLRLPNEVQRMIYREVLVQNHQPVHPQARVLGNWAPVKALFKVSKGTRELALEIFYSQNTFELFGAEETYEWIRHLRPEKRKYLRHVVCRRADRSVFTRQTMRLLSQCKNLRTLKVSIDFIDLLFSYQTSFDFLDGFEEAKIVAVGGWQDGEFTRQGRVLIPEVSVDEKSRMLVHIHTQLKSACPEDCMGHGPRSSAVIVIDTWWAWWNSSNGSSINSTTQKVAKNDIVVGLMWK